MIRILTTLTLRQLLGRGRVILLTLMCCLPLLMAVIFAAVDPDDIDPLRWTARTLQSTMVVALLLPMTALIFGAAAFGSESEDGTAVYILSKPIPRWKIYAAKFLATWGATVLFVALTVAISGFIAAGGERQGVRLVSAFGVAAVIAAAAYSAVFVTLGILTSRAFIIGLAYVFLWENLITRLFTGTRVLSIRQYALAIAEGAANVSTNVLDARLAPASGWILVIIVTAGAAFLGVRRLRAFELGEAG